MASLGMKRSLKSLGLTALMLMGLAACGTTLETQQNRYKKNTDTIQAVAAKKPTMATAIKAKIEGFNAEKDTIIKAGGEDAKTKLARLNSRMEAYAIQLDPSLAPASKGKKAAAASTGKKAAAASKAPATTSKLAPKSAASVSPAAPPSTPGDTPAPAAPDPAGSPPTVGADSNSSQPD